MKLHLKKHPITFLLSILISFFCLNNFAQMNQKEADSLKIVLRNTTDKQLKNSIIYKILNNTFNADSIKHYLNLGLENSKNTNNEWYAKYTAMGARLFYFTDKEQFYSIYKTALAIAKSKETKAYIYRTLAFQYQMVSQKDSLRFYLDKVIAQKPEDVKINIEIFYLKGALYAANKDYNNAIPYYNKAKDLAIATGKTKELYRYYHQLSFAFYYTGKIDLAIQTLEKALKNTLKDTYEYGRTYELMAAFTGTLNPNDSIVLVYNKLAVNAYLNGKIENELIASGLKNLAVSYLDFNQLDNALQTIRKVKAYNDISETSKNMVIEYNFLLADYFNKKQVLDSAEIYVRKVLTLTENEAGTYKEDYYESLYKLGQLSIKKNDHNLATTYFLK
jgi:tetratricopeptide (TPR) repeat protein